MYDEYGSNTIDPVATSLSDGARTLLKAVLMPDPRFGGRCSDY
jgi:hypothetical protein